MSIGDKKPENSLESVIGLEIHVQLKTQSKMFCPCPNIFGDVEPNTAICPICLGYPGTLPVPNDAAIRLTHLVGAALNCELAAHSKFDRKHYFYPDLPKGYQISQYDQPFCGRGFLEIAVEEKIRHIGITRAHLEEDAAKNTHPAGAGHTLVDYNRAGTPLLEIVTEPDLRSPLEAKIFLQELRDIMRALRVSDADMEKGQLRCDANISVREKGSNILNPKTEIKNLNSFRHVEKALQVELGRLRKLSATGELPARDTTRGYQADSNTTTAQRSKEGAADYRYFPEPDIPPFFFTAEELKARSAGISELPSAKRARFMKQFNLSEGDARLMSGQSLLADFFENTVSELRQLDNEQTDISPEELKPLVKKAHNLIVRNIRSIIEEKNLTLRDLKITPANFAEFVVLVHRGKITSRSVDKVLAAMQETGGDPDHIIDDLGLAAREDGAALDSIVEKVLAAHPDVVGKIKSGKESAIQFLLGQVMAETKGTASPPIVIALLRKYTAIDK